MKRSSIEVNDSHWDDGASKSGAVYIDHIHKTYSKMIITLIYSYHVLLVQFKVLNNSREGH